MNSKIIFLAICILFLTSCGVKSKPLSPPETAIDSYIKTYTDSSAELTKEEKASPPSSEKKK